MTCIKRFLVLSLLMALPLPALGNAYLENDHWDSGKAEFQVYDARIDQYGIPRDAAARLILVKEPFDLKKRVKTLQPDHAVDVMKFLFIRQIPAGVYDHRQTAALYFERRTGQVLKYTMSSQDGCGNTFMEYSPDGDGNHRFRYFSYFDEEGEIEMVLRGTAPFTFYDALPVVLRFRLEEPAEYRLNLMESLMANRVRPLDIAPATVRHERRKDVEIGGQQYPEVIAASVTRMDREDVLVFDAAFPHRLLRWDMHNGDRMTLGDSRFFYYWEHTRPEDRHLLRPE